MKTQPLTAEEIAHLADFRTEMDQPSGVLDFSVGDLYAIVGALSRDSHRWEAKAARVKDGFTKSDHEYQAKSYGEFSDRLSTYLYNLRKGQS